MDPLEYKARVDAARWEIKEDRRRQARGFAILDRAGRAQGAVDRVMAHNRAVTQAQNQRQREVYGRIGERIDARIERARSDYARYENARLRAVNQREAARIRDHGYDISPEFRRRSAQMANAGQSTQARNTASGVGISTRWRGATRQVGLDASTRITEAQRDAAILARRPQDVRSIDPESYDPERRPQVRSTVTYRDHDRTRSQRLRTDRPPPRQRR